MAAIIPVLRIRLTKPVDVEIEKSYAVRGHHKVPLIIMYPKQRRENAPGVLWIHGGGYLTGMKEMVYMSRALDLVRNFGAVVVSPDYTLSVFKPYPAAVDDCYASLLWLRVNAERLGINHEKICVGGESAGGGLCAAVCMMARDRGAVKVAFQMPLYPMMDNFYTKSSFDNHGRVWNTFLNDLGWKLYLRKYAKADVSPYAAPARQTDYSGLPPCYTFVGNGEPFYCETMTYVDNLKKAGVEARADVYNTTTHSFDMLFPNLRISKAAAATFDRRVAKYMK